MTRNPKFYISHKTENKRQTEYMKNRCESYRKSILFNIEKDKTKEIRKCKRRICYGSPSWCTDSETEVCRQEFFMEDPGRPPKKRWRNRLRWRQGEEVSWQPLGFCRSTTFRSNLRQGLKLPINLFLEAGWKWSMILGNVVEGNCWHQLSCEPLAACVNPSVLAGLLSFELAYALRAKD